MKVVSVINYKGGVGKTTLTANLASYLARFGERILLVDMDAQCNLTHGILTDNYGYGRHQWEGIVQGKMPTLRDWYWGMRGEKSSGNGEYPENLEQLIIDVAMDCWENRKASVIPSHLDLLDVDMELAAHIAKSGEDEARRRVEILGALRRQLRSLSRKFDLVLLDCPPNFNIVTQTAIIASDNILIPTRPNDASNMGTDHLIRRRGMLIDGFNKSALDAGVLDTPKILGVVPMMWKVQKGEQPIEANERVKSELAGLISDLRGREEGNVVLFHGVRHNEKLFSENSPHLVLDGDYAKSNQGGEGAANDIRRTAIQVLDVIEDSGFSLKWIILKGIKDHTLKDYIKDYIDEAAQTGAFKGPDGSRLDVEEFGREFARSIYHFRVEMISRVEKLVYEALKVKFGEKTESSHPTRADMFRYGNDGFFHTLEKHNRDAAEELRKMRAEGE